MSDFCKIIVNVTTAGYRYPTVGYCIVLQGTRRYCKALGGTTRYCRILGGNKR